MKSEKIEIPEQMISIQSINSLIDSIRTIKNQRPNNLVSQRLCIIQVDCFLGCAGGHARMGSNFLQQSVVFAAFGVASEPVGKGDLGVYPA